MPNLKKQSEEHLTLSDLSRACASEWRTLSQYVKQQYHDQVKGWADKYKKAIKEYEQTEEYTKFQKQKAAHYKSEKLKQFDLKGAPKRPRSAYIFYTMDVREKFKEENPHASAPDMIKVLAESWKNLPHEETAVYIEKAKWDKVRYEEEMEVHQNSAEYKENKSKKEEYLANLEKNSPKAKEKEKFAKAKAREIVAVEKAREKAAKAKAKAKAREEKAKQKSAKEKANAKAAEAKAKEKAAEAKAKEKAREVQMKAKAAKAKAKEKAKLKIKKAKEKERLRKRANLEKKKAKEKLEKEKKKLIAAQKKEKLKILKLQEPKDKKVAASS